MFDCHYDLLSYILIRKDNKEYLKKYCQKVYKEGNITGGIFNLFYMTVEEMKKELGIDKDKINLIQNLKDVKEYIDTNELISKNIKYIFGIEGLDYLENIDDIDILYSLGLRSVNLVWNNKNKFGGGVRASKEYGLTKLGEQLIKKLIQKKIAIDLSHANETTFFDIINLCKNIRQKSGMDPIVFASHSNAKAICNVPRNLTDKQIRLIKELGGIIGIVSIKKFCIDTQEFLDSNIDYEQEYIKHINYIRDLLGGVDNIAVATDDMKYYFIEPEYYQNINIYLQCEVRNKIRNLLIKNHYKETDIENVLENNFKEKILKRLGE